MSCFLEEFHKTFSSWWCNVFVIKNFRNQFNIVLLNNDDVDEESLCTRVWSPAIVFFGWFMFSCLFFVGCECVSKNALSCNEDVDVGVELFLNWSCDRFFPRHVLGLTIWAGFSFIYFCSYLWEKPFGAMSMRTLILWSLNRRKKVDSRFWPHLEKLIVTVESFVLSPLQNKRLWGDSNSHIQNTSIIFPFYRNCYSLKQKISRMRFISSGESSIWNSIRISLLLICGRTSPLQSQHTPTEWLKPSPDHGDPARSWF